MPAADRLLCGPISRRGTSRRRRTRAARSLLRRRIRPPRPIDDRDGSVAAPKFPRRRATRKDAPRGCPRGEHTRTSAPSCSPPIPERASPTNQAKHDRKSLRRLRRLFDHGTGVGAAEAEGIDGCDPRPVSARPRLELALHANAEAIEIDMRVGTLEVQARRNFSLAHAQGRFDQPRDASRRLEVADIGLDRTDDAGPSPVRPSPNTVPIALASIGSPTAVPVPCAST